MKKGLVIGGSIVLLISLIISIALIVVGMVTYKAPDEDYYAKGHGSGTFTLEEGSYNIWSDIEDVEIEVTDPQGDDVDVNDPGMDLYMQDLYYVGSITADEEGDYYFDMGSVPAQIYIQHGGEASLYSSPFCFGCCCGLIFIPLGAVLLIVGMIKKSNK